MSAEMIVATIRKQFEMAGEALTESKPKESQPAETARYSEDAILFFLDRPATLRRLVEHVWATQRAGRVPDPLPLWLNVSVLFQLALRQANSLRESIAFARAGGFRVEREEEFERTVREIEALRGEFQKPFFFKASEGEREAALGLEYLDADEAFAHIAGVDVETWRQRMAEYERHRQG